VAQPGAGVNTRQRLPCRDSAILTFMSESRTETRQDGCPRTTPSASTARDPSLPSNERMLHGSTTDTDALAEQPISVRKQVEGIQPPSPSPGQRTQPCGVSGWRFRMTGNEHDAEDVVQEAFLSRLSCLGTLRQGPTLALARIGWPSTARLIISRASRRQEERNATVLPRKRAGSSQYGGFK